MHTPLQLMDVLLAAHGYCRAAQPHVYHLWGVWGVSWGLCQRVVLQANGTDWAGIWPSGIHEKQYNSNITHTSQCKLYWDLLPRAGVSGQSMRERVENVISAYGSAAAAWCLGAWLWRDKLAQWRQPVTAGRKSSTSCGCLSQQSFRSVSKSYGSSLTKQRRKKYSWFIVYRSQQCDFQRCSCKVCLWQSSSDGQSSYCRCWLW